MNLKQRVLKVWNIQLYLVVLFFCLYSQCLQFKSTQALMHQEFLRTCMAWVTMKYVWSNRWTTNNKRRKTLIWIFFTKRNETHKKKKKSGRHSYTPNNANGNAKSRKIARKWRSYPRTFIVLLCSARVRMLFVYYFIDGTVTHHLGIGGNHKGWGCKHMHEISIAL